MDAFALVLSIECFDHNETWATILDPTLLSMDDKQMKKGNNIK